MKKKLCIYLLLCCVFISGCGNSVNKPVEKLKIGLILNFDGVNDRGRNQAADAGLNDVYRDFSDKVETKMFEVSANGKNEQYLLRLLATNDYKMVFIFDDYLGNQLPEIVATYPNTHFIRLDSVNESALDNLQEVSFDVAETGFVAGALAGIVSKNGQVGFVDCNAGNRISNYEKTFVQGMKLENKEANLVALNMELLTKSSSLNVDIIFINGTLAEQLEVIKACSQQPILFIVCGANPLEMLNREQQQKVVATTYKDTARVLYEDVKQQINGGFTHGKVKLGFSDMMFKINDAATMTAEQTTRFELVLKKMNKKLGE